MSARAEIPKHVAIIMDGNGRWATRRGHPRVFGHVRGASRVEEIVRTAGELGIRALTLYVFSTENWNRPRSELNVLWRLLKKFITRKQDELDRQNVRLDVIGEWDMLDEDVRAHLARARDRLAKNTGLRLTLAIPYGAQRELTEAARRFAQDCVAGRARPEDLTEGGFERYLWTSFLGELANVDLVIRTSGEQRVSNFLLWQSAYAEYCFHPKCWPDFRAEDLKAAVADFGHRERRFGGLGEATRPASTQTLVATHGERASASASRVL